MGVYLWPALPTTWLLAYWPLQTDLKDASPNGKNGSWGSGTGTFWTVWGRTWARVTESSYYRTQWINTTLTYGTLPISFGGWFRLDSRQWLDFYIWIINSSWKMWLGFNTGGTWVLQYRIWENSTQQSTSTTLSTQTWYCVFVTVTSTTVNIYVNWSNVYTATWTYSNTSWNRTLGSMYKDEGGKYWWTNAYLNNFAVYNRALTAAEVKSYYDYTKI